VPTYFRTLGFCDRMFQEKNITREQKKNNVERYKTYML